MSPSANIVPPTRYAVSSGLHIAYQVFGQGPVDVIMVPGFISNIEHSWREPSLARFLHGLSAFARVIAYDKRGMGLSDRDPTSETPSLDQRIDDILAVMDAAASSSAVLLAWSDGGPTAISFATAQQRRTDGLILASTTPSFCARPDFEEGVPREIVEELIDVFESEWGTGVGFEIHAPTFADDQDMRNWWAACQRSAATPGAVAATLRLHLEVDVRAQLSHINVPTLVIHQRGDMVVPVECGRYLATHIPGASMFEPLGDEHMFWLSRPSVSLGEIRKFLGGTANGGSLINSRRSRRRAHVGWDSLSDTENDVVRLLALGMTNREIAERMFVSPRTVQTHLTHIMAKLDMKRRTEVAAAASRHL